MVTMPPPGGPDKNTDAGFPDFGGDPPEADNNTLDNSGPAVATSPKKIAVVVTVILGLLGYLLMNIFTSEPDKPPEIKETKRPALPSQDDVPLPAPPPPPAPPPAPPPPPPPPPEKEEPAEKANIELQQQADEQARIARLQSESVVVKGGSSGIGKVFGGKKKGDDANAPTANSLDQINDPNSAFALRTITNSAADKAVATHIGPVGQVIAQGKMIDSVLETAISTDLPGSLRAIVSHDIYAEGGRDVLIPKGSRLVGTYNTGIMRGQERVFIVWTRAIRPDGIDIMIGSEGTDALGRAGVKGNVDNKFLEIFTSAVLTSSITLGVAAAVQAADIGDSGTGGQVTRRTFGDGSTEDTADPTAVATGELVTTLGSAARDIIQQYIDVRPTITIDQGTHIKVFVNRDLQFPTSITQQVHIVQ